MAETVVVQPASQESSSVGMILAVILILALVTGGVFIYRYGRAPAADTGGTNINVTLPTGSAGGTSSQ